MPVSGKKPGPSTNNSSKNQHIQVSLRCRPLNPQERSQGSCSVIDASSQKNVVSVRERNTFSGSGSKTFTFDNVFGPSSTQLDVYKLVTSPIIDEVLQGYNCTVFAYGQTGTGKTYTMEGEHSEDDPNLTWDKDPQAGIIPRAIKHIFDNLISTGAEFSVRVSYVELYNEELFDLLGVSDEPLKLRIYEDSGQKGGTVIHGLEEIVVHNRNDVYKILEKGSAKRKTESTLLNLRSSRSHAVFSVTVHIKEVSMDGDELLKIGKLNLVDLAGSENIGRSGAVDKRAREAGNINQSLLTLGRVITCLVERAPHIPYRESKLTRMLQDSLGGRTKTSIIATISPAACNYEETLSTLDYAFRARNITNKPEVNQKLCKKTLLKHYTGELERLRKDLIACREKNGIYMSEDNYAQTQNRLSMQADLIRELEEKIEVITEEKNKLTDLFEMTKSELDNAKEEHAFTLHVLDETKISLAEERFLVEEHVKAEAQLTCEAEKILDAANSSVQHVQLLHDKVTRKQNVEDSNISNREVFSGKFQEISSSVSQHISTSQQEKLDLIRQAQDILAGLKDDLLKFKFSQSDELLRILSDINSVRSVSSSEESKLRSASESLRPETQNVENVKATLQSTVIDFMSCSSGKLESLINLCHDGQKLFKNVQERYTNQIKSMVDFSSSSHEDSSMALKQMSSQLSSYARSRQESSEGWLEKIGQCFTDLKRKSEEQDKAREDTWQMIREYEEANLKSHDVIFKMERDLEEFSSQTTGKYQKHKVAVLENLETVIEHANQVDVVQKDKILLISDLQKESTEFHNTMDEIIDKNATDTLDWATIHHNRHIEGATNHEFISKSLTTLSGDIDHLNSKLEDAMNNFSDKSSVQDDAINSLRDTINEKFAIFSDLISNATNQVDNYIKDSKIDIPTGMTPQRREFVYPKVLSRRPKHSVLREAFRSSIASEGTNQTDTATDLVEDNENSPAEICDCPNADLANVVFNGDASDSESVVSVATSGVSSSDFSKENKDDGKRAARGRRTRKPLQTAN